MLICLSSPCVATPPTVQGMKKSVERFAQVAPGKCKILTIMFVHGQWEDFPCWGLYGDDENIEPFDFGFFTV